MHEYYRPIIASHFSPPEVPRTGFWITADEIHSPTRIEARGYVSAHDRDSRRLKKSKSQGLKLIGHQGLGSFVGFPSHHQRFETKYK